MEAYQHALGISTVAAKSLQIEADADIAHALIGVGACLRVIGHAKKVGYCLLGLLFGGDTIIMPCYNTSLLTSLTARSSI
jgi:hypothetical protein